uniref:RRM domain-containing protein n=1 Tax=viral metagenome TaxID=1070528 RepID=A0A6C0JSQ8_9ZZZZ
MVDSIEYLNYKVVSIKGPWTVFQLYKVFVQFGKIEYIYNLDNITFLEFENSEIVNNVIKDYIFFDNSLYITILDDIYNINVIYANNIVRRPFESIYETNVLVIEIKNKKRKISFPLICSIFDGKNTILKMKYVRNEDKYFIEYKTIEDAVFIKNTNNYKEFPEYSFDVIINYSNIKTLTIEKSDNITELDRTDHKIIKKELPFLTISNLDETVTPDHLINLLCIYDNVLKVQIYKSDSYIHSNIEVETLEGCDKIIEYLDGMKLKGKYMVIYKSGEKYISQRSNKNFRLCTIKRFITFKSEFIFKKIEPTNRVKIFKIGNQITEYDLINMLKDFTHKTVINEVSFYKRDNFYKSGILTFNDINDAIEFIIKYNNVTIHLDETLYSTNSVKFMLTFYSCIET